MWRKNKPNNDDELGVIAKHKFLTLGPAVKWLPLNYYLCV